MLVVDVFLNSFCPKDIDNVVRCVQCMYVYTLICYYIERAGSSKLFLITVYHSALKIDILVRTCMYMYIMHTIICAVLG